MDEFEGVKKESSNLFYFFVEKLSENSTKTIAYGKLFHTVINIPQCFGLAYKWYCFLSISSNSIFMAEQTRGIDRERREDGRHQKGVQTVNRSKTREVDFESLNYEQRRAPYKIEMDNSQEQDRTPDPEANSR